MDKEKRIEELCEQIRSGIIKQRWKSLGNYVIKDGCGMDR